MTLILLVAVVYKKFSSTCYLFVSVSPDKLLVDARRSSSQLLWALGASELLTCEPEVQVFLAELRFQKVPEQCLSTCYTAERHLTAEAAAATLDFSFVMLEKKINVHLCERSVSRDSPRKPCLDSFLE